jgi:hypothetical protein
MKINFEICEWRVFSAWIWVYCKGFMGLFQEAVKGGRADAGVGAVRREGCGG